MKIPTYESTKKLIQTLKLDEYPDEVEGAVRSQQFLAFRLATRGLPEQDQETLFAMIWDSARVVGHLQAVRAHASIDAPAIASELARQVTEIINKEHGAGTVQVRVQGISRTCPGCPSCSPQEPSPEEIN